MTRVHPFDICVLVLLASALLPISPTGTAAVWTAAIIGSTLVQRRRGRERAAELSRASMVPGTKRQPAKN